MLPNSPGSMTDNNNSGRRNLLHTRQGDCETSFRHPDNQPRQKAGTFPSRWACRKAWKSEPNQTEAKLVGCAGVVPISATSGLPMKQHGTTR